MIPMNRTNESTAIAATSPVLIPSVSSLFSGAMVVVVAAMVVVESVTNIQFLHFVCTSLGISR